MRAMTSWPGVRDDLVNAGATWLDQPFVRDGNLATRTTRTPSMTSAAATGCSCRPKDRRCCCCRRWRSTSGRPREGWIFWRARYDAPAAAWRADPKVTGSFATVAHGTAVGSVLAASATICLHER